jgi:hypothetical protein
MKKPGIFRFLFSISGKLFKIGAIVAGAVLIFRKKEKIAYFFKSSNFFVAAMYGLLVSMIALIYRLIVALNWIIQQAR